MRFYALLLSIVLIMFLMAIPALAGGMAVLRAALMVSVIFVLCGIGFKIAAVPWHMWCPDVCEGASTPFTAFLSVGPKADGFALAIRVLQSSLTSSTGAEGVARGLTDVPWPAVVGARIDSHAATGFTSELAFEQRVEGHRRPHPAPVAHPLLIRIPIPQPPRIRRCPLGIRVSGTGPPRQRIAFARGDLAWADDRPPGSPRRDSWART
jgi:hypothetical protein